MVEFDLSKVYNKFLSKKDFIKLIKRSYDEKFQVIFLPRDANTCDILIRSCDEPRLNEGASKK